MKLQTTKDSSPIAAPLSKVLGVNGEPVVDAKWSYMGRVNTSIDEEEIPEFFYCNKTSINKTATGETISCLAVLVSGRSALLERESLLEFDCSRGRWRESFDRNMFGEWFDIRVWETRMGNTKTQAVERYKTQAAQVMRARVQAVCSPAGK